MGFLYYYIIIGSIYSIIYTYKYLEENKNKIKELKATKKQIIGMGLISFFITLIIYPISIVDELLKYLNKGAK